MGLLDDARRDLDSQRERVDRDRENSARLAQAYAIFKTTGTGTSQYEDRIDFGLTFIEKPVVSYCSECDIDDIADAIAGSDFEQVPLPVTAGFVVTWDRDERDFYTGCWVAVRVHFPDVSSNSGSLLTPEDVATVEIGHHFTFAAVGIKDIPPSGEDANL